MRFRVEMVNAYPPPYGTKHFGNGDALAEAIENLIVQVRATGSDEEKVCLATEVDVVRAAMVLSSTMLAADMADE